MKRVSFIQDTRLECEYLYHENSLGHTSCTNCTLCSCGKYICEHCMVNHLTTSLKHRCKHRSHSGDKWGTSCSCGQLICEACSLEHMQTSVNHKCESPYHDNTNGLWGKRCSCNKNICTDCMELHLLCAKRHD